MESSIKITGRKDSDSLTYMSLTHKVAKWMLRRGSPGMTARFFANRFKQFRIGNPESTEESALAWLRKERVNVWLKLGNIDEKNALRLEERKLRNLKDLILWVLTMEDYLDNDIPARARETPEMTAMLEEVVEEAIRDILGN